MQGVKDDPQARFVGAVMQTSPDMIPYLDFVISVIDMVLVVIVLWLPAIVRDAGFLDKISRVVLIKHSGH